MKIAQKKLLNRIIIVALLTTLLTFNVGRVQSVKAVGTTIALASGAALCTVGIIYCSYMALTGASVHIPDTVQNVQDWLSVMGSKVVQYPSGREAYEDVYSRFLHDPTATVLHDFVDSEVWTWTAAKLRSWANDFSSTEVISSIAGTFIDTSAPTTNFAYDFNFIQMSDSLNVNGSYYNSITDYYSPSSYEFEVPAGARIIYQSLDDTYIMVNMREYAPFRNAKLGNSYFIEVYDGSQWIDATEGYVDTTIWVNYLNNPQTIAWLYPQIPSYWDTSSTWVKVDSFVGGVTFAEKPYPIIADADIYDYNTAELIETRTGEIEVSRPQWPVLHEPDGDKKLPVIPYYQTPWDPNWIDPITGQHGGGHWGFGLDDLLDLLESLAGYLMEIGALGELINRFANDSGDTYYISYDDSVTGDTYYNYNTITNISYGDDIVYQYNIDVSHVDEELPVDLNTIQNYTSNRYLDTIKRSASGIGSVIGEWFAFWHNVDAEIVYVIFGAGILTIIAAFIGKWGHS